MNWGVSHSNEYSITPVLIYPNILLHYLELWGSYIFSWCFLSFYLCLAIINISMVLWWTDMLLVTLLTWVISSNFLRWCRYWNSVETRNCWDVMWAWNILFPIFLISRSCSCVTTETSFCYRLVLQPPALHNKMKNDITIIPINTKKVETFQDEEHIHWKVLWGNNPISTRQQP